MINSISDVYTANPQSEDFTQQKQNGLHEIDLLVLLFPDVIALKGNQVTSVMYHTPHVLVQKPLISEQCRIVLHL